MAEASGFALSWAWKHHQRTDQMTFSAVHERPSYRFDRWEHRQAQMLAFYPRLNASDYLGTPFQRLFNIGGGLSPCWGQLSSMREGSIETNRRLPVNPWNRTLV